MMEPRFVAVHNTMAAMGLAQTGSINEGSLPEGADARMTQHLEAGQCYTYVGLGGGGVDDLDVRVLDDAGTEIGRDGTRDRQAAAQACPDTTGDYQLVIHMQEGSGDYTVTAWSGAPRAGGAMTAQGGSGQATCAHPLPLEIGRQVHGDTSTGTNSLDGSCAGGDSNEHVYLLRVDQRVQVSAVLQSSFDGALYIEQRCGDQSTELMCNDDNPDTSRSQIDLTLDPGTYYLVVDGYSGGGEYDLIVSTQQAQPIAQICGDAPPLTSGHPITGTTQSQPDSFTATCGGSAHGGDRVYRMDIAARSRVRIREQSDHDGVLYMRSDCTNAASEIACNDDFRDQQHSLITATVDPGTYFVYSDGFSAGRTGSFTLNADIAPDTGGGAPNDTCAAAAPMTAGAATAVDTFSATDDLAGSCGGQGSPDVVQRIDVSARSRIRVSFGDQEFTGVAYLRRACADTATEVACTTFFGPNGPPPGFGGGGFGGGGLGIVPPSPTPAPAPGMPVVAVPQPAPNGAGNGVLEATVTPGTYYLIVDGASANDFGAVQVTVAVEDIGAMERTCRAAPLLRPGRSVSGSTATSGDHMHASCAGGAQSNDQLYRVTLARRSTLRLTLSADFDAALYIRHDCLVETSEVACNDDSSDNRHSFIEQTLDAGTYYVVVDGFRTGNQGSFTLDVAVGAPGASMGPPPGGASPQPMLRGGP
ncbi:MAG: PPC domain-containing protein [Sandaracinaceae bacterium]|nr:PPC domain-containing protein [Sandaracinaceae bacterium]